jgi:hypothetical protein
MKETGLLSRATRLRTVFIASEQGSIPRRDKTMFVLSRRPALGPTQPPVQLLPLVTETISSWIKRPGLECDHSPTSNDNLKNARNYTSTPTYVFMAWCLTDKGQLHIYLFVVLKVFGT